MVTELMSSPCLDRDHYKELFFLIHYVFPAPSAAPGRQWMPHRWLFSWISNRYRLCCIGIKEFKDCESENWGCVTVNILLSTCCIKLKSVFTSNNVQPETVVKGILVQHCTQWNLKENDMHKKMTASFMIIKEAYSKPYLCGFVNHNSNALPRTSLLLL